MAGGDGRIKSPFQQNLREQRLGVDVGALAEQQQAEEGEQQGSDEAGHEKVVVVSVFVIARSEATKQSSLPL
jgi:hypothetical protein